MHVLNGHGVSFWDDDSRQKQQLHALDATVNNYSLSNE